MRRVAYSKFSEEDLGIEMEDLLRALSDYLLKSGYQDPYMQFSEMN
jgi:Ca-activated chloride channel family protein